MVQFSLHFDFHRANKIYFWLKPRNCLAPWILDANIIILICYYIVAKMPTCQKNDVILAPWRQIFSCYICISVFDSWIKTNNACQYLYFKMLLNISQNTDMSSDWFLAAKWYRRIDLLLLHLYFSFWFVALKKTHDNIFILKCYCV